MAKPRRPSRTSADVRGTLGSLVRSTLAQAGVVRDVLERGAREGRARLEEARRDRARDGALADLGQAVLELLEAGRFPELMEEPAVADAIAALEEHEAPPPRRPAPGRRARVEDDDDDPAAALGRWARKAPVDDGTVSSAGWRPPPARGGAVWRPPVDDEAPAPAPRRAGGISFSPADDDDDLADYMHPDDVPPR